MILFQAIFIALITVFSTGLYFGVVAPFRDTPGVGYSLAAFFLVGILKILWLPLIHWRSQETTMSVWDERLERGAHAFMAFFSLVLFVLILSQVVHLGMWIAGQPWNARTSAIITLALSAVLHLIGYTNARRGPRINIIPLSAKNAPALRIAQISDLHIGSHIRHDFVQKVVDRTNALKPDLIVLTGDIADGDSDFHLPDLEPLRDLKAALGIYYCTGNHEHYWDEKAWKLKFQAIGFDILDNEFRLRVKDGVPFAIAGVNDTHPDYAAALAEIPAGIYTLFIAHHPEHLEKAKRYPFDLQLSGHTHGGQFIPWSLLIGFFHRHSKGLYSVHGRKLYVNVGTGYWGPPLRLGTRSEISQFDLSPQQG